MLQVQHKQVPLRLAQQELLAEPVQRRLVIPELHKSGPRAFAKALQQETPRRQREALPHRQFERVLLRVAHLTSHLRSQSLNLRPDRVCHDGYDDDGVCALDHRDRCLRQRRAGLRGRFAGDVDHRLVQR